MTAQQAADALAGLEVLQGFYQSTGKRFSLHSAAVQLTEAAGKLDGHSLAEAVDGFLDSVAAVKRISVREGIEQFIAFRKGKTVAADTQAGRGQRVEARKCGRGSDRVLHGPGVAGHA